MFTDIHLEAFDSVVRQLNVSAYLCGGTVRDLLLGRSFHDVDVVLSDRVFEAAELFRSKLHAPSFVLDEERQVARVVFGKGNWDFTGFRNHTIEGDLRKRDFTINAIAIRWEDFYPARNLDQILDPYQGREDLKNRMIRSVAPESLEEDPLRMVRAYRMQSELKFDVDPEILNQISRYHSLISGVASERIVEELNRIFLQEDSARTWRMLGQTPLFDSMFPELSPMKNCLQGGYHHLDVWDHSVLALENFERLLLDLERQFPKYFKEIREYIDATPGTLDRRRLMKWASILHDIGKPQTQELKEPGRWRFHAHDRAGADLAQALLKRLKFSRKDAQLISLMIEHHLRPLNLFNHDERGKSDYYKFFRLTGSESLGVLLVSYGDLTAARGSLADPARDEAFAAMLREMVDYYFTEYYPAVNTPELIKGRDLIGFLQMRPGPEMGALLKEIRELQLQGKLTNRQQALEYARSRAVSRG